MNAITRNFVTAGKAIFTVEPPAKLVESNEFHAHYTYLVERVDMPASGKWPAKTCYFVKSLTGPDNTSDYTYLGMLNPETGEVRLTAKSAFPADATRVIVLQRVLYRVWRDEQRVIENAGWKLHHAGHCGRCGRQLTTPDSVESGFGPECIQLVTGQTHAKLKAARTAPAVNLPAWLQTA